MKTCSACHQIRPDDSFYRDGSWCQTCRKQKRAEWKARYPSNEKAHKLIHNSKTFDPTAYAKLQCEHIATYAKRAIERFERRTGLEAPPELTAIHQLANRLTDQQHAQLVARNVVQRGSRVLELPTPRECENCGKTYTPRNRGKSRWCSSTCRHTARDLADPEAYQRRRARYAQREREANAPRVAARRAQQEANRIERAQARYEWQKHEQRYIDVATQAANMRRHGHGWQQIADTLGYGSPGAAHNAIRLRLKIDPASLHPAGRHGTTHAIA